MALTEQAYNRAAAAEAAERNGRPHLTDARKEANVTYQRRRARTAVDVLLEIDPEHYDEHTRRVLIETLPRLAAAGASPLELPEPLQAAWCDYTNDAGHPCTMYEGHAGDHDPDPYAAVDELSPARCRSGHNHTDRGAVRTCEALRPPPGYSHERETVWCEAHGGTARPHFERGDCVHPHFTDQETRARLNRELHDEPILHDNGDYRA